MAGGDTAPPGSERRRALLSVSDKSGLAELARGLTAAGVELVSTGGTARHLQESGLTVTDVAAVTGFPEIMDGRVKTLHPRVFGGILARRDRPDDLDAARRLELPFFDFVVVNLYPFAATVARADCERAAAVENIDIGGPSLIRAAAKNHEWLTVLTDPRQYPLVIEELSRQGATSAALRRRLMVEAFRHTAAYDSAIASHFARVDAADLPPEDRLFPPQLTVALERREILRYGENSHQAGALYADRSADGSPSAVRARQLNGKQLSWNNLLDLDAALGIVARLDRPGAAVIKHNNPCGAAIAEDLCTATQRAFAGDETSAFGSVVGLNRVVDEPTARWLGGTPGLFVEAIIAPGFEPEALRLLTTMPRWKANVRLLATGPLSPPRPALEIRSIAGGALLQDSDNQPDSPVDWKTVTDQEPDPVLMPDLAFAWEVVRAVRSNAIVVARQGALAGVGAGQMSRVDAVEIALRKAGVRAAGAVLASDAFFPFPDSLDLAAAAGVAAIIQPGGSVRDEDVIAAANRLGIAMLFTGKRHFRH